MISPSRRSAIPVPSSTASSGSSTGSGTSGSAPRRLMSRSLSRSRDTLLLDTDHHHNHHHRLPPPGRPTPDNRLSASSSAASSSANFTVTADTTDDLHTFTLLEENIALKESCEHLSQLHTTQQQLHTVLNAQLAELRAQCDRAQQLEHSLRTQLQQANAAGQRLQEAGTKSDALVAGLLQRLRDQEQQQQDERHSDCEQLQQRLAAASAAEAAGQQATAAAKAQLTSTELQLYEANERVAELTEELSRAQAEGASVTRLARLAVEAVRSNQLGLGDVDTWRQLKAQHVAYATLVARGQQQPPADSGALLEALRQVAEMMMPLPEVKTLAGAENGQQPQPLHQPHQQQQQQQQKPPLPQKPQQLRHHQQQSPTIDAVGGEVAVAVAASATGVNGRRVQMMPKYSHDTGSNESPSPPPPLPAQLPPIQSTTTTASCAVPLLRPMLRPPPPPVPPRHFSTSLATGSLSGGGGIGGGNVEDNRTSGHANASRNGHGNGNGQVGGGNGDAGTAGTTAEADVAAIMFNRWPPPTNGSDTNPIKSHQVHGTAHEMTTTNGTTSITSTSTMSSSSSSSSMTSSLLHQHNIRAAYQATGVDALSESRRLRPNGHPSSATHRMDDIGSGPARKLIPLTHQAPEDTIFV